MWPWEHLAVGYLLYSALTRTLVSSPPSGPAALLVAAGTQVPDLVDKPLAWVFDLVPVAYAIGHSALIVVPGLAVIAALVARRTPSHLSLVGAYAVGHLSHLVGDVVYPALIGGRLRPERILWPIAEFDASEGEFAVLEYVSAYVHHHLSELLALDPEPILLLQMGLVGGVVLVWLIDGAPGVRTAWRLVARFGSPTS